MRSAAFIPAMLLLLPLAGCGGRPAAVPRPRAFPRTALYPRSYRLEPLPFGPDSIAVNDSTLFVTSAPGWFDIVYPAYGITVNCTLTAVSPASAPEVLANRTDRMARNLADRAADIVEWGGVTLCVAPAALRTPVQFLATDSASYVLSGVAVSDFPSSVSADSVAPLIDAVAADLTFMLRNL